MTPTRRAAERVGEAGLPGLSACSTCGELVFADEEQFMAIHGLLFHASCARYQRRLAS